MNEVLQSLIDDRDNMYYVYIGTGDTKDKAMYNRAMKKLREYVELNNVNYKPIDLFDNEPQLIVKHDRLDTSIDISDVDDTPDRIDELLEGEVIDL